jgi:hypothetical protein
MNKTTENKNPLATLPKEPGTIRTLLLQRPRRSYCFAAGSISWTSYDEAEGTLAIGFFDAHVTITGRGLGRIRTALYGNNNVVVLEQGEAGENLGDEKCYVRSIRVGPRREIDQSGVPA